MARGRTAYLFITAEGVPSTVFDSQVIAPLRDLAQNGLVFDLIMFRGVRSGLQERGAQRARAADMRRALSPGRVWLHSVPFPNSRSGILAAAVLAAAHLAPSVLRGKDCLCHCRGIQAGSIGVWIKRMVPRCRIVFDLRGDISEQAAPGSRAHAVLSEELGRIVGSACRVICVSESFRRQLAAWYPGAAEKTVAIPCAASATLFTYDPQVRRQVRAHLELEDRLVLVYCGGLAAPWHIADRIVGAFRDLRAANPEYHLLLVTPDVERARQLSSELGIDDRDVTIASASHSEVPGYLMAADVALLLRRRDSVNAVASPTKLAEYLMTGLPVAASEGIGDVEELFALHEFGALIRDIEDGSAVDEAVRAAASMPRSDEARAARATKATSLLSSQGYLQTRIEVYRACEGESA